MNTYRAANGNVYTGMTTSDTKYGTIYNVHHIGATNALVQASDDRKGQLEIIVRSGGHEGRYVWMDGVAYMASPMGDININHQWYTVASPADAAVCIGMVEAIIDHLQGSTDNVLDLR
jgi:hypothetical protein